MGHFSFPVICTVLSSVAHCDYFPSFYNLQGISLLDLELFSFFFNCVCSVFICMRFPCMNQKTRQRSVWRNTAQLRVHLSLMMIVRYQKWETNNRTGVTVVVPRLAFLSGRRTSCRAEDRRTLTFKGLTKRQRLHKRI